jgi:membrane-associated phospholipid phosphatase
MPSVHLAVTSVLGLALGWRVAVVATLAMSWSLVFTGEHYLIDVLVGLLIALSTWLLSRKVA